MEKPHVVVIGGGFGGVYTTKQLLKRGARVTLVNERNYFTFTPLLHEVATGILTAQDTIFEFESFFKHKDFTFVRGRVSRVHPEEKTISLNDHHISYDYLVIATGAQTNQELIEGSKHAYSLKSIEEARAIKKRVIELAQGPNPHIDVCVIGGGPTGVELTLELKPFLDEIKRRSNNLTFSVTLIHAQDHVLKGYSNKIRQYADRIIQKQGVRKICCTYANRISPTHVSIDGEDIPSNLTILTAGVVPRAEFCTTKLDRLKGHICVQNTLQSVGIRYVFALGDVASVDGKLLPKLAQTATHQAKIVAENIFNDLQGKDLKPFKLRLQGQLVSLGYGRGGGDIGKTTITGPHAWFIWRTVYLFKTPGFWNKLRVAFSWTVELFRGRILAEE